MICLISCKINGRKTKALFNTGAQVSIASQCWLEKNLPKANLQNILEIMDAGLDRKAANGTTIPYVGWEAINVAMVSDDAHANTSVPFLGTSTNIDNRIIGYNVIEEAIKINVADCTNTANTSLMKSVIATFHEASTDNTPAFIDFVYENAINHGDLCALKTSRKTQIIPKGGKVTVRCRANVVKTRSKIPILSEPDLSSSMSSDRELT